MTTHGSGPLERRPDVEQALRLLVAERDALIRTQQDRIRQLEYQLEQQYQLVARYRRVFAPVLLVRRILQDPGVQVRDGYQRLRRFAWRHPRLARPAVWLKRLIRSVRRGGARSGRRQVERRVDLPCFDASWYLARNPQVVAAGLEPLEHYLSHGIGQGLTVCRAHAEALVTVRQRADAQPPSDPLPHEAVVGLASVSHPNGYEVIAFDTDALVQTAHDARAPERAAARVTSMRTAAQRERATKLASGDDWRARARTLVSHYRARWVSPRPAVSRAFHHVAERGAGGVAVVASQDVDADQALLTALGFELEGVRVVERLDDLGDGEIAYVTTARDARAATVVTVPPPEPATPSSRIDRLQTQLQGAVALHIDGVDDHAAQRVIHAAFETSLLPAAMVAAAIEHALRHGLERIHYMSREGRFLADTHERIANRLVPGAAPDAVHLEVSRRSTFGPSLSSVSADELMDLWRMYSRQSVRAMLTSLGADPQRFVGAAKRHGLDIDAVIEDIHRDQAVHRFLADPSVARRVAERNAGRRQALLAYLRRVTDPDVERWLVVDVGWRGTIQDNLARLMPALTIDGLYLALFPFLNPQPPNVTKRAVGPDANHGDEFAFMEPPAAVERPWTADVASVVDYELAATGTVVATREKEHLGVAQADLLALHQRCALRGAEITADWIAAEGLTADDLHEPVCRLLERYYRDPWPGTADLWFGSTHDDTFGVLNVTPFGKDPPHRSWLHADAAEFSRILEAAAQRSLWPAGYRRWLPVQAVGWLHQAIHTDRGLV